jgi:hypothetical protein
VIQWPHFELFLTNLALETRDIARSNPNLLIEVHVDFMISMVAMVQIICINILNWGEIWPTVNILNSLNQLVGATKTLRITTGEV